MAAPRARNRRGEGARLRDEIVVAAVGLIDETADEHAVTLRSVARRVGVAPPSIYRHFPNQPSIMLAVVQDAFAELEAVLQESLADADPMPPGACSPSAMPTWTSRSGTPAATARCSAVSGCPI